MPNQDVMNSATDSDAKEDSLGDTSKDAAQGVKQARGTSSSKASSTEPSRAAIFLDREMSQIAFNWRVLAQAEDKSIPLLERLKYLCIVGSNLDEFFEVRVASLLAQNTIDGELVQHPAFLSTLKRISSECHQLTERQYELLNQEILPQLSKKGCICCVTLSGMTHKEPG
jgi:polyphosphate kinase